MTGRPETLFFSVYGEGRARSERRSERKREEAGASLADALAKAGDTVYSQESRITACLAFPPGVARSAGGSPIPLQPAVNALRPATFFSVAAISPCGTIVV